MGHFGTRLSLSVTSSENPGNIFQRRVLRTAEIHEHSDAHRAAAVSDAGKRLHLPRLQRSTWTERQDSSATAHHVEATYVSTDR